ncbi:hypothetical protein LL946_09375 [Knoellia locipacati]|uniref:hypothetical protein n=1 Tax=Knoellia locipacati TaxID=882824 RepID=UPI00384E9946
MIVTADLARRLGRLLVVLVCAVAATWGFASGPHTTSHVVAGAATPGHHHAPGGHAPQTTDEGTQVRTRRRVRDVVVRLRPAPLVPAWAGLRSLVRRRLRQALSADLVSGSRHAAYWSSPTLLCVSRT